MANIWNQFYRNEKRLIHKWKHYFPIYETHFSRYVNRPCVFLEIGCGRGGSLQLWKSALGPHAQIVGVDINPECKNFEEDQIAVRIGNQADENFLAGVFGEFGPPDIILDDGSHMMGDLHASFQFLYPRMSSSGIYMVEDLHTCYWDEYGGGYRRAGTFMETIKDLIDQLNADHARGMIAPSDFTRNTLSMHLYDSVCVFEKGRTLAKHAPMIGHHDIAAS